MNDEQVDPIIREFVRNQSSIDIDHYSDKGGFGHLYFGKREIFGDRVALKFYPLDEEGNAHAEPQLLQKITHDNILPIHDARIISDKYAYYLTPQISGGDLQDFIDKNTVTTNIAIDIVRSVLMGLNELHKDGRDMVHMDLKTANILVDKANLRPYLSDFGSIKKIADHLDYVIPRQFSILYNPPEALLKNRFYKQSDLYQMGIVLYQVLGGRFPMENPFDWVKGKMQKKFEKIIETDDKILFLEEHIKSLIRTGKLVDFKEIPPYISKRLRGIVKKAVHTDHTERYQTCAEFIKALYDYQSNHKDWWKQDGNYHAYCKTRKRGYRIVQRKSELVVESSADQINWRKVKGGLPLAESIDHIEAL